MLDAPGKLGKILTGMNRALGEIPLTVKLRTGVKEGKNTSHRLMPRVSSEWNVAAMTVGAYTLLGVTQAECESSFTAERASSVTQNSPIGSTSRSALTPSAHASKKKIVSCWSRFSASAAYSD